MLPLLAQARLGETYDQLVGRYGQPLKSNADQTRVVFKFEGVQIGVAIRDGKSAMEMYSQAEPFPHDTTMSFLSANAEVGQQWQLDESVKGVMVRDDKAAYAVKISDTAVALFTKAEYTWWTTTTGGPEAGSAHGF